MLRPTATPVTDTQMTEPAVLKLYTWLPNAPQMFLGVRGRCKWGRAVNSE